MDRYADAPGQQVAHHAHTVTMTDPEQLRALIEAEKPDLVVPEIEAIATPVLEALEDAGAVRVIPTARAARLTMDREGIRRLAGRDARGVRPARTGSAIRCPSCRTRSIGDIGYPCVVKPVMSSSGKGQSKIDGPDDVAPAWEYAMSGSRVSNTRIIVEGFIDFDYEITLLTVRRGASVRDPVLRAHRAPAGQRRLRAELAAAPDVGGRAGRAPSRSRWQVTENLGGQGIFGVELFVKGDQVWFSEVSPRPHDTGMVTMVTQWQNEFELHARAILGLPVDTTLKSPGASAVIYGGVDAKGVVFDGVDAALAVPRTDIRLFGKPESFVKRRMGVALAYDADVDVARANAVEAAGPGHAAGALAVDSAARAHSASRPCRQRRSECYASAGSIRVATSVDDSASPCPAATADDRPTPGRRCSRGARCRSRAHRRDAARRRTRRRA